MRFMLLMRLAGEKKTSYEAGGAGAMPDAESVAAMMRFNESMQQAGVLLALDGLQSPAVGARVSFAGGKPSVTDGPFAETNEVVGGYWMIRVGSREEAVEWARKCPASADEVIEVRQVFETTDFPADVQKSASGFCEMKEKAGRA